MASWVIPLFVIVAAVSLFVQMLIFGAMFLTVLRLTRRMEALADDLQRRVNPVISRLQMLVEEAQPRISNMISDAAEITHVARSQVQRMDRMVTEAVDRLRMQLVHADQILTGAMETVEETGARREYRCSNGDTHRHDGDPHPVPDTWVKGDVGHGIDLRIERNQVKGAGDPGESVADAQSAKRPRGADARIISS